MLEKIGLPAKPSMRGGSWVLDASHCQGCSSQFTFINRKHHCRRCGGLFCNTCTQQRMVLRGQGDSPVRICDPCKKIEEAARIQLRYGHRKQTAKVNTKQVLKNEEEVLGQILGTDGKHLLLSEQESDSDMISDLQRLSSSASCSNLREESASSGREEDIVRGMSVDTCNKANIDTMLGDPEELRQQAVEEKRKYKTLKAVGKSEEALQAFKRGKELERQAGALEIAIRKSRRMALMASNMRTVTPNPESNDHEESDSKQKLPSQRDKEAKNDLAAELRELGWSDVDLHNADKKPAKLSLEGGDEKDDLPADGNFEVTDDDMNDPELAAALKSFGWSEEDVEQVANQDEQSVPFDREALQSQILSLKKEALSQKRAGNVSKALEILKKAKLLEKDLENMKSSPEISESEFKQKSSSRQVNVSETTSSHFESPPKSKLMIQKELLALKKRALTLRREGRIDEAEEELKKGKVLEQQLEEMENASRRPEPTLVKNNLEFAPTYEGGDARSLDLREEGFETEVTEHDMCDPAMLSLLKNLGWNEDDNAENVSMTNITSKRMNEPSLVPPKVKKNKADIQKELLAIKRKALALRRQGKSEEAEEELEKAKALENQMAEMEVSSSANFMEVDSFDYGTSIPQKFYGKEQAAGDVRNTPDSLASFAVNKIPKDEAVLVQGVSDVGLNAASDKNKAAEASVVVPKILQTEKQMLQKSGLRTEEISVEDPILHQSNQSLNLVELLSGSDVKALHSSIRESVKREDTDANEKSCSGSGKLSSTTDFQISQRNETNATRTNISAAQKQNLTHGVDALQDEILALKRRAVALKREGKLAEAREELRQAKLLEKSLEDGQQANVVNEGASSSTSDNTSTMQEKRTNPSEKPKSGRDRFRIQQESLSHKRNALKLRREGKIDESEAELELAKALEKQLEEFDQGSSTMMSGSKSEAMEDVVVEDLLDPQLMSALKAIGLEGPAITSQPQPHKKTESQPNFDKRENHGIEKAALEEQIKAEKLRALDFKRAGKQAEALEALRLAKRLEKKLASMT
ncbi:FYVE [Musa troglodytarum]|uniref:FYVE n=1 Tax=Musa troglodytarum TaxID=320322 RepID=A0A9E7FNI9_9LILI|nr:FYVE [Musa troglodytarum]URE00061.1 FYVE [Musa troglodytarum]URE00062.1 FYVE [Musa troglodytarum]